MVCLAQGPGTAEVEARAPACTPLALEGFPRAGPHPGCGGPEMPVMSVCIQSLQHGLVTRLGVLLELRCIRPAQLLGD